MGCPGSVATVSIDPVAFVTGTVENDSLKRRPRQNLFKTSFGNSIFSVRIPAFNRYMVSVVSHAIQSEIGHDRVRKERHPILGRPIA